ncbi:hypothetical protein O9H32_18070 [Paenibacillus mucilaginosus]|nr:hypothetical protein [Paenibacillus caseinilyticus]
MRSIEASAGRYAVLRPLAGTAHGITAGPAPPSEKKEVQARLFVMTLSDQSLNRPRTPLGMPGSSAMTITPSR